MIYIAHSLLYLIHSIFQVLDIYRLKQVVDRRKTECFNGVVIKSCNKYNMEVSAFKLLKQVKDTDAEAAVKAELEKLK